MHSSDSQPPRVGVVVLNYHQPATTIACIRSLLAREPQTTRILWVENDAARSRKAALVALASAPFPWIELDAAGTRLPEAGTVGVIFNPENLGYGAGNNTGLRLLHRAGVPYAWVLNNDTELLEGSSADLLASAEARPDIGAWGAAIQEDGEAFSGGILSREFASRPVLGAKALEESERSYASGCSLFVPLRWAAEAGFIPEDFFLYYEDAAFGFELRRRGHPPSATDRVVIRHSGSLSAGKRSPIVEFYNRRNRWEFIRRYFPGDLPAQKRRIPYTWQKLLFRGRLDRILLEWRAYHAFKAGRLGPWPSR